MIPSNFMVIGLQIGKLHTGERICPPALPDSGKPSLFRVKQDMKLSEIFVRILISLFLIGYQKSY